MDEQVAVMAENWMSKRFAARAVRCGGHTKYYWICVPFPSPRWELKIFPSHFCSLPSKSLLAGLGWTMGAWWST